MATQSLDASKITTTWNLSFLYKDKDAAKAEYQKLSLAIEQVNQTYRPRFNNLTGTVLLDYIQNDENFSKSLNVLSAYANAQKSLDVNDIFFQEFLSDVQNLSTEYVKANSFADVILKSLPRSKWEKLFSEEPQLEKYRPYLEANYIRFVDHRPKNETHAAYLADLSNQLMKLDTNAEKLITNNVDQAGNITLENGKQYAVNYSSYYNLLTTNKDRNDRKKCYDQRYYHLFNESHEMGDIYVTKSKLDDKYARELNYSDDYDAMMFSSYLNASQIDEMNQVIKERRGDFDRYYEFREAKMGVQELAPYDLFLQLMKNPDKKTNYTDALEEIYASLAQMDPAFEETFIKTVTSNSVDAYPNLDHGKQSIQYAQDLCALKRPALVFLNYNGLIDDKSTIAHEMGHAIDFYLMGQALDYIYCGGTIYEMEIPSTFNEELFVDYAINNYDKDTAIAVLASHINNYARTIPRQAMITEFEHKAHQLVSQKENVSGSDLNALWDSVAKEYKSDKVAYYPQTEPEWTYISHIYFTNNYYTFNYALSEAITLSLFKMFKENPEEFNRNYVAYLSAGTTMTPPEKLKKYFGLEINRKLFEDAMDIVKLRVDQLEGLDKGTTW
ncbi:MAG: M3 family oligoendopeptidase [Methanothrix sp.]|nr:M3 family oligoendopeptidase [Methanothrix sp.]